MPMVFTNTTGQYIAMTTGSAGFPQQSARNNGQTTARMGMPSKPNTMSQGSVFSNARQAYIKDAGGGKNWYGSSTVTQLKRINAIGQSSTKQGLPKGAIANTFKSGGRSAATGTGNRTIANGPSTTYQSSF
jgi:hypothetical protein